MFDEEINPRYFTQFKYFKDRLILSNGKKLLVYDYDSLNELQTMEFDQTIHTVHTDNNSGQIICVTESETTRLRLNEDGKLEKEAEPLKVEGKMIGT